MSHSGILYKTGNDAEVLILTCLSCSSIPLLMKTGENFIAVKKPFLGFCVPLKATAPKQQNL